MHTNKKTCIRCIVFIFIVFFSITGCSQDTGGDGDGGSGNGGAGDGSGAEGPLTVAGTIEYPAISMVKGSVKTFSPQIVGESSGASVTYSIEPALSEQGCSFNEETGAISIDASAEAMQKTYTVTATGTGNYKGSISTQVTINIANKRIDGTLTYTATAVRAGKAKTATPTWSGVSDSNQTVRYSLGTTAPAWLTIDSTTGVVSIATTAPVTVSTLYQVMAEGIGNYSGTINSTITIAIESKDVIDGVFSYPTINMATGVGGTFTPQITGATIPSQTIVYSVDDPLPTGINLNPTTGTITIDTSASNVTKVVTIVARGTGNYVGQLTSSVRIHLVDSASAKTINGTLAFTDFAIGTGLSGSAAGSWAGVTDANQKIHYSIDAPGTNITIDADGRVQVPASATTTATSEKTYTISAVGVQEYTGSVTSSIKITIEQSESPEIVAYNTTKTSTGGAVFGPYIKDTGLADADVATISGLINGRSYAFTLGNKTVTKTANGTSITIRKSDISGTVASPNNAAFGAKGTLIGGWVQAEYNNHELVIYKSEVYTWKDLQAIRMNLSGSYTLMNDITFPAAGSDDLPATGFEPLGNGTTAFTGTFNGNSKVIKKLAITPATADRATTAYVGLFGNIVGASTSTEVVKNLTLEDPVITGGYYVGALVGAAKKATFTGIAITKSASASASVGVKSYGKSSNIVPVLGLTSLGMTGGILGGGLAGNEAEKVTIIKSYNTVSVSAEGKSIGGLVGIMGPGKIVGYAETEVGYSGNSHTQYIGGLVGAIVNSSTDSTDPTEEIGTTVIGYFKGNIKAEYEQNGIYDVGGLVGITKGGKVKIYGFALGNIEGTTRIGSAGGLVGKAESGSLKLRGYHKGDLKLANQNSGGLVGSQLFHGLGNLNAEYQGYSRTRLYVVPAVKNPSNIGYLIGGTTINHAVFQLSRPGSKLFSSSTENIFLTSGTNPVPLSSSTDPTLADIEGMEIPTMAPSHANNIVDIINVSDKTEPIDGLDYGTDVGEWTYTSNKWPALNLGDEMPESAMSTQPIDP